MIRLVTVTLIALAMMGGLAISAQADSIPTSGTVTGNSTLTPTGIPGVFVSNFIGSGVDSVSGAFKATNTSITIFSSLTAFISTGTFSDVFAGGTVFGTFFENGSITGATSAITIHTVTTGGTGIFAGDTGEGTVIGTAMQTGPTTSSFNGTYTGFITVPEPSSLALMLAGIGLLPLMRKHLARGRQAT